MNQFQGLPCQIERTYIRVDAAMTRLTNLA